MISELEFYKETNFKEAPIGKISKDFEVVKLDDITESMFYGVTAKAVENRGRLRMLRTTDIKDYQVNWDNLPFCEITEKRSNVTRYLLKQGDLIIARAGTTGVSVLVEKDFDNVIFGSYLIKARLKSGIYPKFIHYFLQSRFYWSHIVSSQAGSTLKNITLPILRSLQMPLPSLIEQQQIAEILSTVDEVIQKTNEVIAKTERLKKGLMKKLLTKGIEHKEFKYTAIGRIPKDWEVTTIDKECNVGTGGTPARNNLQYFGGNIPWVKSTEIDYNIITRTEESLTESGLQNSNAKIYPAGSLAIALYGQGITRGKCAIFGIDAAVNQACAVIQSKGRIHIPYLFYWFQHSYSRIRSMSQGANQSNLNLTIIRSLELPLPSILEQQKIAEIISIVDNKLELERKEKTKMERIKQGLVDLLFTGQLRVKVN